MRAVRFRFEICIAAILLALSLAGCAAGNVQNESDSTAEAVSLEILAPSDSGDVIARGRHFKVSGSIEGAVPDDAVLTVSLHDESGEQVRFATTSQKGTGSVLPESYAGPLTWFDGDTTFEEVAYTAPELVATDPANPLESGRDATIKCVYTDETFYALITAATDPAHGLVGDDGYALTDENGDPYTALPEGSYRVEATLASSDGTPLATAERDITIGKREGTIIHEVTSADALAKGGMELLLNWAEKDNLTVLVDLLPGMFGPYYQASTMPLSVGSETAEYLPGKIMTLLYNNKATSTSTALEISTYLHLEQTTEDPGIASYYVFDIGEPMIGEQVARIIRLADDESIHLCRIDEVTDDASDGVFLTTEEQIVSSDVNGDDGWTASASSPFALMGVTKPYQLQVDELVPHEEIYGYYEHLNGVETLSFTFAPVSGGMPFTVTKPAGLARVDQASQGRDQKDPGPAGQASQGLDQKDPGPAGQASQGLDSSLYEFYCVFEAGTLPAGDYEVFIAAFDRNGAALPQLTTTFNLTLLP